MQSFVTNEMRGTTTSTYYDALQRIREKAFYAHLLNAKTDEDEYLEVIPLEEVFTPSLSPFIKRTDDLWLCSFQCLVQKSKGTSKVLRVIELSTVEKALGSLALQPQPTPTNPNQHKPLNIEEDEEQKQQTPSPP